MIDVILFASALYDELKGAPVYPLIKDVFIQRIAPVLNEIEGPCNTDKKEQMVKLRNITKKWFQVSLLRAKE